MIRVNLKLLFLLSTVATFAVQSVNAQQLTTKNSMGRLFYSIEERSVLEAVRQGIVDPNVFNKFNTVYITPNLEIPQVVFNPKVKRLNGPGNFFERNDAVNYNGIIRSVNTNKTQIILGNKLLRADELTSYEDSIGIKFKSNASSGSVLYAEDKLFKSNIELRRGDTIGVSGNLITSGINSPVTVLNKRPNIVLRRAQ